jgi:hypothetical protein
LFYLSFLFSTCGLSRRLYLYRLHAEAVFSALQGARQTRRPLQTLPAPLLRRYLSYAVIINIGGIEIAVCAERHIGWVVESGGVGRTVCTAFNAYSRKC